MLPQSREWDLRLDLEGRERFGGKWVGVAEREKDGQLSGKRSVQLIFRRLRW